MITKEYLKSILDYNKDTGIFIWVTNMRANKVISKIAGSIDSYGAIRIKINKKLYFAHRLAWFYIYDQWPKGQIDHINGVRDDNRIENLRDVTHRENQQNRIEHRLGNLVGAIYNINTKKWQSQIVVNKKKIYLGQFDTELEAHKAYLKFLNNLSITTLSNKAQ